MLPGSTPPRPGNFAFWLRTAKDVGYLTSVS